MEKGLWTPQYSRMVSGIEADTAWNWNPLIFPLSDSISH